jgi:hypothetical protein
VFGLTGVDFRLAYEPKRFREYVVPATVPDAAIEPAGCKTFMICLSVKWTTPRQYRENTPNTSR